MTMFDHVGSAGLLYLVLIGVWVPYLALKTAYRLRGNAPIPISRMRFLGQTAGFLLFLLLMAVLTARREWIDLTTMPRDVTLASIYAIAFLAALLLTLRLRWSSRPLAQRERLYALLPHDRREFLVYLLVCLAAGIGEEVVYRGVLATILTRITGSFPIAVIIASIAFSVAHSVQGWRAVASIFLLAIAAHALVAATGSLIPMMFVHTVYDAVAGFVIPRWYRRDAAASATPLAA